MNPFSTKEEIDALVDQLFPYPAPRDDQLARKHHYSEEVSGPRFSCARSAKAFLYQSRRLVAEETQWRERLERGLCRLLDDWKVHGDSLRGVHVRDRSEQHQLQWREVRHREEIEAEAAVVLAQLLDASLPWAVRSHCREASTPVEEAEVPREEPHAESNAPTGRVFPDVSYLDSHALREVATPSAQESLSSLLLHSHAHHRSPHTRSAGAHVRELILSKVSVRTLGDARREDRADEHRIAANRIRDESAYFSEALKISNEKSAQRSFARVMKSRDDLKNKRKVFDANQEASRSRRRQEGRLAYMAYKWDLYVARGVADGSRMADISFPKRATSPDRQAADAPSPSEVPLPTRPHSQEQSRPSTQPHGQRLRPSNMSPYSMNALRALRSHSATTERTRPVPQKVFIHPVESKLCERCHAFAQLASSRIVDQSGSERAHRPLFVDARGACAYEHPETALSVLGARSSPASLSSFERVAWYWIQAKTSLGAGDVEAAHAHFIKGETEFGYVLRATRDAPEMSVEGLQWALDETATIHELTILQQKTAAALYTFTGQHRLAYETLKAALAKEKAPIPLESGRRTSRSPSPRRSPKRPHTADSFAQSVKGGTFSKAPKGLTAAAAKPLPAQESPRLAVGPNPITLLNLASAASSVGVFDEAIQHARDACRVITSRVEANIEAVLAPGDGSITLPFPEALPMAIVALQSVVGAIVDGPSAKATAALARDVGREALHDGHPLLAQCERLVTTLGE